MNLFNNEYLSVVELNLNNNTVIFAHKSILVQNSEFFHVLFSKNFKEFDSEVVDLTIDNIDDGISLIEWFYSRDSKIPYNLLYLAQQWMVPDSFVEDNSLDIPILGKFSENIPENVMGKLLILVSTLLNDYEWTGVREGYDVVIRRDKQGNGKNLTNVDIKYFPKGNTSSTYYGLFKVKDDGDLTLNRKRKVFGNVFNDDLNELAKLIDETKFYNSNMVRERYF